MNTNVSANLKTLQDGQYKMYMKNGMLNSYEISSKVKGTLLILVREIPIPISKMVTIKQIKS
jgi:hypothetical protein